MTASASIRIVRNFHAANMRPCRPIRLWQNSTGPGLVSFTKAATASIKGSPNASAATATTTSITRLSNWSVDRSRPLRTSIPLRLTTWSPAEIPYDDIVRDYAACGRNVESLANKLGIPAEVLLSRLRRARG